MTSASSRVSRVGWVGLLCNLALAAAKAAAGILGHSQAVLADALHSLTDSVTDIAVILGVRYWTAPADDDHPHGHGRIETLITVLGASVRLLSSEPPPIAMSPILSSDGRYPSRSGGR